MRGAVKSIITTLLIACLLFAGVSCTKHSNEPTGEEGGAVKADADLFSMNLSLKVEHTFREGDSHYLYALFPDGQTGFYQSTQPGVLPEIRDLSTGKVKEIRLADYRKEDVEFLYRTAVVMTAKRYGAKDTAKLEEKLATVHGLDILKSLPDPLALRYRPYSVTSAQSDCLALMDYNTGAGGMLDPQSGLLYNSFRDDFGSFEPISAYGSRFIGKYGSFSAAVLDTAESCCLPLDVVKTVGYTPKGTCMYGSVAYLKDGSIAATFRDDVFTDNARTSDHLLGIIRQDGGTELYTLGTNETLNYDLSIVSNDPNYIVAAPMSVTGFSRLINRTTGEVSALMISGIQLTAVSPDEARSAERSRTTISFLDVLDDGHTMIVRDGYSGAIGLFRPDTMQTMILPVADQEISTCIDFCGDHKGRLCTMTMPRGGAAERGILLTIIDGNGNPVF